MGAILIEATTCPGLLHGYCSIVACVPTPNNPGTAIDPTHHNQKEESIANALKPYLAYSEGSEGQLP